MTKNGELILNIINQSTCHPTAEQIYLELKKENSKAVLATVYNNLTTLVTEGKIKKLKVDDGPDRYDKLIRHDHLVCCRCGKISDYTFEDLTSKISKSLGIQIESYDLKINYVCDDCKNEFKN